MSPIEEVLSALEAASVRYLVVGGVAVVLHGHLRATADLDLVVQLDPANTAAAVGALTAIGLRPRAPVALADFSDAGRRREWIEGKGLTVLSLWSPDRPGLEVDLFVAEPVDFDAAHGRALRIPLDEVTATVIGRDDLIALKRTSGRPQDLLDVEALQLLDPDDHPDQGAHTP